MDDGHNSGHEFCAGFGFEVFKESPDGRAAEFAPEPAGVLEEDAQHFRDGHLKDGRDKLAVHLHKSREGEGEELRC